MATGDELLLKNLHRLKCGTSLAVMGSVLALATPGMAMAQTTADEPVSTRGDATPDTGEPPAAEAVEGDEGIIVTGTRRALATSQGIKRDAETVVDSITATDIGAFPDKSVAEALQRVPGITVNRFAASDDTSHFSADPSGVIVRGLSQVRSEFNGRDTFSANSSRGLSWSDISPELMAGVDVFKNQTADMIEGGIAGSINLRTRVPFDAKGQLLQATVNANFGDRREEVTPEVSATYSNRWNGAIGDFGILLNGAYSQVKTQSDGVVYGRTAVFDGVYGPGMQFIPSSVGLRETNYDRTRIGVAGAAQWQDPSGKLLATAQFNHSEYEEAWRERGVISYLTDLFAFPADFTFTQGGPFASRIPRPAPGTPAFTFDEDGNFETGVLTNQQTDFSWWGGAEGPNGTGAYGAQIAVNDQGRSMFHPCYSWGTAEGPPGNVPGGCGADARGPDLNAVTRYNESRRKTQDAALNLKWEASDRLDFNFDAHYVRSSVRNYDVEIGQYSFANVLLDASGRVPTLTFSAPTNINQSAGGLANPNNYRYNHAMDHVEDSEGEELAFRVDGEYELGSDWLDSLKFGARYADRDQDVRYSAYNWGNISNNWNMGSGQAAYWNIDRTAPSGSFTGYPAGLYDVRSFRGNDYVFFDMGKLENHAADLLSFSNIGVGQDRWQPVCSNGGEDMTGPRTAEIAGTCFRPDELNTVSEATKAAYAVLRFGGSNARIGSLGIRGNIGLRFVETKTKVFGSTVFPNTLTQTTCSRNVAPAGQPQSAVKYSLGCYLFGNAGLLASSPPPAGFTDVPLAGSPAAIAFNNSGSIAGNVETTHQNWLPSFNLRVDLSPTWLIRFAASKALSRPDIGLLRNYTTISSQLPGNDPNDPRYIKDGAGNIIRVAPSYQASGYNPSLKPITATQFDISLENYFSNVGFFSAAAFYKKFQNYIQYGSRFEEFTNNGVTNTIERRGPENGKGGNIFGLEATYQRFFDFLPGALSGLGIQVNGTYVKNDGIENSGLKNQSGTDGGGQAQPGSGGTTLTVSSLEGLSKYAYNLVGMYEKYGLAVRVAYNWRSRFLVTAVDCCTYLPTWQESAGFLDATIRYAINNNIELSLQGSNLLNTETRLRQQVTSVEDGAILTPNAWFRNDRRFVAGARFKF